MTLDDKEQRQREGREYNLKGKRGEYIVIGELLGKGLRVYTPVSDEGIDCVVDTGGGEFKEVQIKYSDTSPSFQARKFNPSDSLVFVCWYDPKGGNPDWWTIPSRVFRDLGHPFNSRGRDYIRLTIGRENFEKLGRYHHLPEIIPKRVTNRGGLRLPGRIAEPHFKQPFYEREVLTLLKEEGAPLAPKEIIAKMKQRLGSRFSKADLESVPSGRPRWEATTRQAFYRILKPRGLVEEKASHRWGISAKGLALIS
jgi:hypothetical protein